MANTQSPSSMLSELGYPGYSDNFACLVLRFYTEQEMNVPQAIDAAYSAYRQLGIRATATGVHT